VGGRAERAAIDLGQPKLASSDAITRSLARRCRCRRETEAVHALITGRQS